MRVATILSLCCLLLSACTVRSPQTTTTTSTTLPPATTSTSTSTTATPSPPDAACLDPARGEFGAAGLLALVGSSAGDATEVADIRWLVEPGCERLAIDLAAGGGAPAVAAPPAQVELLRDQGVLRVRFDPALAAALKRGQTIDTELVREAFVVRATDGGMMVDLHLAGPAEARAFTQESPAAVIIDLRPGGGPLDPPTLVTDELVITTPRPDAVVDYPITVFGYARFETVTIRVQGAGPDAEAFATASPDGRSWGAFTATFTGGPSGALTIVAGPEGGGAETTIRIPVSTEG